MVLQDETKKSKKAWKTFTVNISLLVLLVGSAVFIGMLINNKRLIESEVMSQARAHFNNIVLTRRWNAGYGGVFVEKRPGVVSNPYLENPDMTSRDGTVYTKKNPALMTREISQLADQDSRYKFNITSLNPLNPNNRADSFETWALKSFAEGKAEASTKVVEGGRTFFRYMAPLYVEEPCLQCHAKQGYKLGDVRGGISIKFDIAAVEQALKLNRIYLIILFGVTFATLLGLIYFFILRLSRKLAEAQEKIHQMAITDELTQLHNRRYFFARAEEEFARAQRYNHSFSCLIFDIDWFKKVNDTHGHHCGDMVLQEIAEAVRGICRANDFVARYGGEEFVCFLPETDIGGARLFAERLRTTIEELVIPSPRDIMVRVTVSVGVAWVAAADLKEMKSVTAALSVADRALYRAKETGRNRVVMANELKGERTEGNS